MGAAETVGDAADRRFHPIAHNWAERARCAAQNQESRYRLCPSLDMNSCRCSPTFVAAAQGAIFIRAQDLQKLGDPSW